MSRENVQNESFHFVLIVVIICFFDNPLEVIREAFRTLKKKGVSILEIIERESRGGKSYEARAARSKFYKAAHFFSAKEILNILERTSGEYKGASQIPGLSLPDIRIIEDPKES